MKRFKISGLVLLALVLCTPVHGEVKKGKLVSGTGKGPVVSAILPPLKGPKKFVAVQGFENKVENPETYWYRNPQLGTGMSDMMVTALMDTGYFIVVEREQLNSVIAEQDLAASGRTTQQGHAQIGKINQAQTLIRGAVTMFEEGTKKKEGGIGGVLGNVAIGFGGGGSESQVGVDIRIFDTATSQVLAAKTCKGFATSSGKGLSLGIAGTSNGRAAGLALGGSDFQKTPIGDATRQAISSAVNFIVSELNKIPWKGAVIKVTPEGKVYINCGRRNGINVGETFGVFLKGESLVDPDTGETLGSEETYTGDVQVISTDEKFSICSKTSGGDIKKESVIRWKGV
jgi:curli biogenesis system outer membrane secretion channel CsgG